MTECITLKYNIWLSNEGYKINLPGGCWVIHRRVYESLGPGHIYHLDGNDKLKRWSLSIHGCVDGFSRKILWLVASSTNNDPIVIGNCFLQCIKKTKIVHVVLRMEKGRENIFCEDLQLFFTGTDDSYIYVVWTRNQRIESFWSRLRKFRTNWWIDFFTRMVNEGVHRPQLETHVEYLLFCFLPITQLELNDVVKTWKMRQVRQPSSSSGGKPDILYHLPETVGYPKMGLTVSEKHRTIAEDIVGLDRHALHRNKTIHELLICYVHIHDKKNCKRCRKWTWDVCWTAKAIR